MFKRARSFQNLVSVLLVLSLLVASCADSATDDTSAPDDATTSTEQATDTTEESPDTTEDEATQTTASEELVSVNYATSFGAFGRDAYAYVALDKGYFEEAGFDVEIQTGGGSGANTNLVAAGQLDFAPADFTTMVLAKANQGVPVSMVSLVHFFALSCVMVPADSGIETPSDLEGASIAEVLGSVGDVLLPLYAERAGFDIDTLDLVGTDPPSMPGLLASGQVDGVGQFIVGLPLFEQVTGGEIRAFCYKDEIPELPGVGIVVRDEMIEDNPEMVEDFIGALNRGLEDAVNNPEEAAAILKEYQPDTEEALAAAELERMREFVITPETEESGIGSSSSERMESALQIIYENFEVEEELTVDDVWVPFH